MQIFTIRKSLHKIKLWNNVRHDSNIYQSLLTTRGIDVSDLFVYLPLITVNSLPDSYNFEYGGLETIDNATAIQFYNIQHRMDNVTKARPWFTARVITFDRAGFEVLNIYTETELDNIAFNIEQTDETTWREIPLKEFSLLEEVEEKIKTIKIPVKRITE